MKNTDYRERTASMDAVLGLERNFDLLKREFYIGKQLATAYFTDGGTDKTIIMELLKFIMSPVNAPRRMIKDAGELASDFAPLGEISPVKDLNEAAAAVFVGNAALIVEGLAEPLVLEAKKFPQRHISEPEKDKVIRGSHDGFVENPILNAALIRRRIRDPRLSMEKVHVGKCSQSVVVIAYLNGMCNHKFLDRLREKLLRMDVEALTMNMETLYEQLSDIRWYNPFPKVRYSERPDVTSAAVLEGHIVLIVDNSPSVMILPARFIDFFKEANDYYFPPHLGTYYRVARMLMLIVSMFLTPAWILLEQNKETIPKFLNFLTTSKDTGVPIFTQLVIFEFLMEAIRISTINTPNVLGGAINVVGGLFVGDFAVQAGMVAPETVFYMSFMTVTLYAQPNFEFGYAIKMYRMFLVCLCALLGVNGLILGTSLLIMMLVSARAMDGSKYMYPLIPLDTGKAKIILRRRKLKR